MNWKSEQLPSSLVWFPLVVSEQRLTDRGELIDVDGMVPRRKEHENELEWNSHAGLKRFLAIYLSITAIYAEFMP